MHEEGYFLSSENIQLPSLDGISDLGPRSLMTSAAAKCRVSENASRKVLKHAKIATRKKVLNSVVLVTKTSSSVTVKIRAIKETTLSTGSYLSVLPLKGSAGIELSIAAISNSGQRSQTSGLRSKV